MLGEPCMPYGESDVRSFTNFARGAALDQLHGLFERRLLAGRQNDMHVVGHDYVPMHKITSLVAIAENCALDGRGDRGVAKQTSSLPRVRRDKIRGAGLSAMFRSGHIWLQGLKPFSLAPVTAGLKPRPSVSQSCVVPCAAPSQHFRQARVDQFLQTRMNVTASCITPTNTSTHVSQ